MTQKNYVDATGLVTQSLTDIVSDLEAGFKSIYGTDINLDANSPDGQMINLFAQAKIDILDCVSQVYNSFSPSAAIGTSLDQRCALNGVIRDGATNTVISVVVTADRAVNLLGSTNAVPFTVADAQGNKYYLIDNQTTVSGTNTYEFIAATPGYIVANPNTVTVISTITLGIISVNNPASAIIQGQNEETDAQLRVRRMQSVALPSSGFLEGLTAGLLSLNDVVGAKVYENVGATTDVNGTPAHSIWAIIDGGSNSDIATVIFNKRNGGCGMRGAVSVSMPTPSGLNMQINFDRPTYVNLYINMTLTSLDPSHAIDTTYIKSQLVQNIIYGIDQAADYTAITTQVKLIDPLAVVVSGGVSTDNVTFTPYLYPTTIAGRFLLSTTRINITVI